MAFIGINNLHYAKLTDDNSSGCTYSTVTKIAGAITVDIQPSSNSNTLYADDAPFAVATALGEITVSIELADLPLKVQADLLGHSISDGVMTASASDKAPYVAILFESAKHDGSTRYVKLLKGMFKEPQESPTTKTDSPEFVTSTIEGTFIAREYDQKWKLTADTSDPTFTGAQNWYSSVE